ncbi:uncharacterized protein LOC131934901, partial [Physella acuta]|uniref:uncharacterized protein LOC131934901 n=1 Tax=Physella acuta TaxID=109671 RepID=UPI0027DE10FE
MPDADPQDAENASLFQRARRWSHDLISPGKFLAVKRFSIPAPLPETGQLSMLSARAPNHQRPSRSDRPASDVRSKRHVYFLLLELQDERKVLLTCQSYFEVKDTLGHVIVDEDFLNYRLIMTSSREAMRLNAEMTRRAKSCENLLDLSSDCDDVKVTITHTDERQSTLQTLVRDESIYYNNLKVMVIQVVEPIRKSGRLQSGEVELIEVFDKLSLLSASLLQRMELLLETWNSQQSTIGQVFHKDFWNCYKIYMSKIPDITRFFKSHQATHGDMFSQLAEPGEQTLETLLSLPVQRLADYGQYIEQLLKQTDKSHPDFEDLTAANNQLESMVNDRKDATGRVSDARPGSIEQNGSHSADRSPGSSREHRTRRKSVPSAILFKTLTNTRPGGSPGGNLMLDKKAILDLIKVADAQPHRMFVLEGQVQLAAGMQIQDRYMFLFTDLLLVAKQ